MRTPDIRIASWNILDNDPGNIDAGEGYLPQEERLEGIVGALASHFEDDLPTILHISEAAGEHILKEIAASLGEGAIYGASHQYSEYQWTGFIANRNFDTRAIHHGAEVAKTPSVQTDFEDVFVSGLHLPHRLIGDTGSRLQVVRNTLQTISKKEDAVVVGDFNESPIQPARRELVKAGFSQVTPKGEDVFPSPHYRGRNIPKFMPNIRLDDHYYRGDLEPENHSAANNESSDHPLLVSEFKKTN